MVRLQCSCGTILDAPNELIGKQAKCASCGKAFTVPPPPKKRRINGAGNSNAKPAPNPAANATSHNAAGHVESNPWDVDLGDDPFTAEPFAPPPPDQNSGAPIDPSFLLPSSNPSPREVTPQDWRCGVAAVLSFVLPGLGQIFKRQVYRGFAIQGMIGGLIILAWMFLIVGSFGGMKHIGDSSYALAVLLLTALPLIGAAIVWGWQVYDAARA